MTAYIRGIGTYLPESVRSNEDLVRLNPTWDAEKIYAKTGIRSRRIAASQETASDLGYRSADNLLNEIEFDRSEIDAILFCTESPDYFLPPSLHPSISSRTIIALCRLRLQFGMFRLHLRPLACECPGPLGKCEKRPLDCGRYLFEVLRSPRPGNGHDFRRRRGCCYHNIGPCWGDCLHWPDGDGHGWTGGGAPYRSMRSGTPAGGFFSGSGRLRTSSKPVLEDEWAGHLCFHTDRGTFINPAIA